MDQSTAQERPPLPRSNRRSRLVCTLCHQKKVSMGSLTAALYPTSLPVAARYDTIWAGLLTSVEPSSVGAQIKCDIQKNPSAPCSKCVDAGTLAECRIRPSRRTKHAPHLLATAGIGSMADPSLRAPPALNTLPLHSPEESNSPHLDPTSGPGMTLPLTAYTSLDPPQIPRPSDCDIGVSSQGPQELASAANGSGTHRHDGYSGPSPASSGQGGTAVASYLGDSGYLRIFSGDGVAESSDPPPSDVDRFALQSELPPPALQESYLETYFRRCYAWCPIVDRSPSGDVPLATESALVQYGIALIGSHIEPPVRQHAQPVVYYERAKALFYANREKSPLVAISGIMLFYWWGCSPPDIVSMDTAWWWTGVAIRQAQQLGLHREAVPGETPLGADEASPSLRRRIWWTLFARERLTSICMGRPHMIELEDCNVAELTVDDFPEQHRDRAEICIYWVRLCAIVGDVGRHFLRKTESTPFPIHLASQLKQWMASLPPRLHLPIYGPRTTQFDPNVHQLHLFYLTTVTLLYLNGRSTPLPRAYATAVLASCCVARIFEDYTARGSMRFLHGMSGWSISIAILALIHARKVSRLTEAANAHIAVLRIAMKEMAKMWHSARMFDRGLDRIDADNEDHAAAALLSSMPNRPVGSGPVEYTNPVVQSPIAELGGGEDGGDGIEWRDFFPFLTSETSPLAAILLDPTPMMQFTDLDWPEDFTMQFHGVFGPGDVSFSMFAD